MALDFKNVTKVVSSTLGEIIKIKDSLGNVLWQLAKTLQWYGYPIVCDGSLAKVIDLIKLYGNSVQSNLPESYTELSYIESSGTQYIDTGIIADDTTGFYASFVTKNVTDSILIGSCNTGDSRIAINTASTINMSWNTIYTLQTNTVGTHYYAYFNYKNDRKRILNDTSYIEISETLSTQAYNLLIGAAYWRSSTPSLYGSWDIYAIQITQGSDIVRNFIPAKRNSDSAIGMYDTVEGKFYTSATSTAFVAGSEATPSPSSPIAIESVGDKTANLLNPNQYIDGLGWYSNGTFSYLSDKCTFYTKLPAGTYTLSAIATENFVYGVSEELPAVNGSVSFLIYSPDVTSHKITLTNESYICVRGTNGGVLPATSVMLNEGDTALDYIPYGYNVPIVCSGRNLINPTLTGTTTKDTVTCVANGDGTYTFSATASPSSNQSFQVVPDTDIKQILNDNNSVLKLTGGLSQAIEVYIWASYSDGTNAAYHDQGSGKLIDITGKTVVAANMYMLIRNTSEAFSDKIIKPMLTTDTTATYDDYQEYHTPVTQTLYLDEPLRKVGDYADVIDIQGTTATVTRNVKEIDSSTLSWGEEAGRNRLTTEVTGIKNVGSVRTKDILAEQYPIATDSSIPSMFHYNTVIYCYKDDLTVNPAGNIIYPLATPTTETYTLTDTIDGFSGYTKITTDTTTSPTDGYAKQSGVSSGS